jgi:hypothetical protein
MEAIRLQPTFAIAWSNLAGLFMETGELQKALAYYKVCTTVTRSFCCKFFCPLAKHLVMCLTLALATYQHITQWSSLIGFFGVFSLFVLFFLHGFFGLLGWLCGCHLAFLHMFMSQCWSLIWSLVCSNDNRRLYGLSPTLQMHI